MDNGVEKLKACALLASILTCFSAAGSAAYATKASNSFTRGEGRCATAVGGRASKAEFAGASMAANAARDERNGRNESLQTAAKQQFVLVLYRERMEFISRRSERPGELHVWGGTFSEEEMRNILLSFVEEEDERAEVELAVAADAPFSFVWRVVKALGAMKAEGLVVSRITFAAEI